MSIVDEKFETGLLARNTKYGVMHLPETSNGLSRKEKSFLDLAMKVAETSEVENQHGAVLVKNGRVLALGINKWRNKGLFMESYEPVLTTHAEVDVLNRVSDAEGTVLYIARSKDGKAMFSRPCWRCMETIAAAGVKRIIYTVDWLNFFGLRLFFGT